MRKIVLVAAMLTVASPAFAQMCNPGDSSYYACQLNERARQQFDADAERNRVQQQFNEQKRETERQIQNMQSAQPQFIPYNSNLMPGLTPQGYTR